MNNQDYEKARQECWDALYNELLKDEVQWQPVSRKEIVNFVFDRAYTLGKQKETITQEEIEKASKEFAKSIIDSFGCNGVPCGISDIRLMIADGFKSGAFFTLGKQEKDADTVIQGWVARDKSGDLFVYRTKPIRNIYTKRWEGEYSDIDIYNNLLFPDITWDSDPEQVEIIIKRKKK